MEYILFYGHWKQYQIIQGPEILSHCPVAFLYTIDPPYTGICTARSNAYPENFQHLLSPTTLCHLHVQTSLTKPPARQKQLKLLPCH
ncbi:hypothetical protein Pelo_1795 [Pelomyxa schiedti]|nr:hypothetical protein Pelo_1795 [Pelomyxa schiedti]